MDRIKGSIYGLIVGDALGVPVEFKKREDINHKITDMIENKSRRTTIGYWSDDTAMTLCTIKSINEQKEINYKDIMDKFLKWAEEGYLTAGDICFGIGQRTLKALSFYKKELKEPTYSKVFRSNNWIPLIGKMSEGKNETNTSGNGSLMRILPVVLYLKNKEMETFEKIKIISRVSAMTHANNECVSSCIYYMFLINHLENNSILEALKLTKEDVEKNFDVNACGNLSRIVNTDFLNLKEEEIKTTGYVIDTLEASLWCLYNSKSYEEAVLKAVNLGGDTDTIAAITGSLAGFYYGYEAIPEKWINNLIKKETIKEITDNFIKNI